MFTDSQGNLSHKKVISLTLIIVAIVMGFMKYDIIMVSLFLGSGLLNIGMTVWMGIKNGQIKTGDNPPPNDDPPPKP